MPGSQDMTLRDHFAGVALNASLVNDPAMGTQRPARWAYEMAEAMLQARDE